MTLVGTMIGTTNVDHDHTVDNTRVSNVQDVGGVHHLDFGRNEGDSHIE